MPVYVVQKISEALNEVGKPIKGSRLLLLGMAYKSDVHDTRESPSLEVMRQLLERGGEVRYCDPWVPELELEDVRHERALGRRRGLGRLRGDADRIASSASLSRSTPTSSSTPATASRRGRTSTRSSAPRPGGRTYAALASRALDEGGDVTLADNWYATDACNSAS